MKKILFLVLLFFTYNGNTMKKTLEFVKESPSLFKAIKPSKKPKTIEIENFLKNKEIIKTKNNFYYFRKEFGQQTEIQKEIADEMALSNDHFAITNKNKDDKDNRIKVLYRKFFHPIAYINTIYKLPKIEEDLSFVGTGYRNSLHQLVTAKHVLSLDKKNVLDVLDSLRRKENPLSQAEQNIKKYLEIEGESFVFDPERISFKVSFGRNENRVFQDYVHLFDFEDVVLMPKEKYDFGIIHLPKNRIEGFNEEIGGYAMGLTPLDKPKEEKLYTTIVGYPAEKMGILVGDSGEIIEWDIPQKRIRYLADTTGGQSGAPNFQGDFKDLLAKENVENEKELYDSPITSTHVAGIKGHYNLGQIHDDHIFEFLEGNKKI